MDQCGDTGKRGESDQMKPPGKVEIGDGVVICMTEDILPIDNKNWAVPSWVI